MGSVVGEQIVSWVDNQIQVRQAIHGAGFGDSQVTRNSEILNYLNNRNSWIKMASGVALGPWGVKRSDNPDEYDRILSEGIEKLKGISRNEGNYLTQAEINGLTGLNLAKNFILFNTVQSLKKGAEMEVSGGVETQVRSATYVKRAGIRQNQSFSDGMDKMYGGLGGNRQGAVPVAGIKDMNLQCINRGSIRKVSLNLKAYNKFQFSIIELLFLRLGYMVMLEWGWDKFVNKVDSNSLDIKNVGSTIIENEWFNGKSYTQDFILNKIKSTRSKYDGNYDGFFGKVSNFTWKLNKDLTYDITLDLISIGSVIESLNCNVPALNLKTVEVKEIEAQKLVTRLGLTAEDEEDENGNEVFNNEIYNNAGTDSFSQWIATTIINFDENKVKTKNYLFTPSLVDGKFVNASIVTDQFNNINERYRERQLEKTRPVIQTANANSSARSNKANNQANSFRGTGANSFKIPPTCRYYVRLGELLDVCSKLFIPDIANGSTRSGFLKIDTSTASKCNYIQNLIPLAPEKVIFNFILDEQYSKVISAQAYQNFNFPLKEFAVNKDNIVYGNVMNCYLNLQFCQEIFLSSKDSKGKVGLFKFLSKICDGINESTGNITNLEPAIRDDNTIYFLEQNQIEGWDKKQKASRTPIEVYGYSPNGTSGFVTDFGFETKITPDLSSLISIGAAANNSSTKGLNAIAFQSWNRGLWNRFQGRLLDKPGPKVEKSEEEIEWDLMATTIRAQINNASSSTSKSKPGGYDNGDGYTFSFNGVLFRPVWAEGITWKSKRKDDAANDALVDAALIKYKSRLEEIEAENDKLAGKNITVADKNANSTNNFSFFIAEAFGGDTGFFSPGTFIETYTGSGRTGNKKKTEAYTGKKLMVYDIDAKFWFLGSNSNFSDTSKNAFKLYNDNLEKLKFESKKRVISTTSGFIPLQLQLTFEGLSGFRIYDEIKVNTKFLPSSYPKTLKFIATKVDQKVINNRWETTVETISVPVTDASIQVKSGTPTNFTAPPPEVNIITAPNLDNFKIIDNRTVAGKKVNSETYGKVISLETFLSYLNKNIADDFKDFFIKLNEKYPGYKAKINAVYRTYQRSIELKAINSSNASPGYSPHNYAIGIDMNIIDPTGKVYLKKDKTSWQESGIPQLWIDLGKEKGKNFRWGGTFSGYVDCVHFDVTSVSRTRLRTNAANDNKGKPEKDWFTKDTSLT